MNITEFLEARITEDEEVARAAIQPEEMYPYGDRKLPRLEAHEWGAQIDGYVGGTWGTHAARHDPARILAECAAKRAIIEQWDDPAFSDQGAYDAGHARATDDAVRALAVVYADHPDYRQEWAL